MSVWKMEIITVFPKTNLAWEETGTFANLMKINFNGFSVHYSNEQTRRLKEF